MDYDYSSMLGNSTWMYDNSSFDDDYVTLCPKRNVNHLGAVYLPTFYHCIFLLSLLGNVLVLYIIYKYEKLNSMTNIFLLNLVISDLVFASSLPFWATYHASEWIFGSALCKMVSSVYYIGFYSSILFLTLMTLDRYLAVVHAITALKRRRNTYACISSAAVWFISILASLKKMILFDVRTDGDAGTLCEETGFSKEVLTRWQLIGDYMQFVVFFLLPLAVVLYCYIRITVRIIHSRMREKCRAVKLIFVIIVAFFICWTPYNVVILLRALQDSPSKDAHPCTEGLDHALYVSRNIAFLYCCINPVFYTFVGKKFRSHFQKILAKRIPCLGNQLAGSQSSRTVSQKSPHTMHE
ncbi:C-C chemokine receptor type 4-like [Megalops cyprinoides]|uniref:C-C chemokine receptor type 4-like n=1 Tax=Megalops cyprinoides TaxID=118141 RepID=UPI0018655E73|nr:C-C chemokine receptor type 4-like [Megalops cyprinoides]